MLMKPQKETLVLLGYNDAILPKDWKRDLRRFLKGLKVLFPH